jgi:hypothetical protein
MRLRAACADGWCRSCACCAGEAMAAGAAPAASTSMCITAAQGFKVGEARHDWKPWPEGLRDERSTWRPRVWPGLFGLQYEQRSVGHGGRPAGMRPERLQRRSARAQARERAVRLAGGAGQHSRDGKERRSGRHCSRRSGPAEPVASGARVADTGKPVEAQRGHQQEHQAGDVSSRGRETLKLPIGQVDTLRMQAQAEAGELDIEIWLSQQHGLLPVRIRIDRR